MGKYIKAKFTPEPERKTTHTVTHDGSYLHRGRLKFPIQIHCDPVKAALTELVPVIIKLAAGFIIIQIANTKCNPRASREPP